MVVMEVNRKDFLKLFCIQNDYNIVGNMMNSTNSKHFPKSHLDLAYTDFVENHLKRNLSNLAASARHMECKKNWNGLYIH